MPSLKRSSVSSFNGIEKCCQVPGRSVNLKSTTCTPASFAFRTTSAGEALAAELIRRQYGMPYERVRHWTLVGTGTAIAERLSDYVAAGVEGFCLSCAHPEPLSQVEQLAEVRDRLAGAVSVR